ncbi:menaquinone biosynthesis protein [Vicingaceae bacterium]|nr:menaquinone biosynthesis protein [Vicingaceae bacterium]
MEVKKIKVSAVSYLNTLPFLYGINNSEIKDQLDLSLDIPSDCAKKLLSGDVDLGLVPVAILPQIKEYHIVSDYCIGAVGDVDSVALYSDVPLNRIESIYLDYQSKTSINLVKVLCKEYWNISPEFIEASEGYEDEINGKIAGVIIGDRTFNLSKDYKFKYDLSGEWMKYSGLPFVFACWVSNIKLPQAFISQFNEALNLGLNNIESVIKNYKEERISKEVLEGYLLSSISYDLDDKKKTAISLFLDSI